MFHFAITFLYISKWSLTMGTPLLLYSKDVAPLVYHLFCFMQRFISEFIHFFIISGEILCRNQKLARFKITKLLPLQNSLVMWQVDEWCSFLTECILKIIFLSSWQETSVFFLLETEWSPICVPKNSLCATEIILSLSNLFQIFVIVK